MLPPCMVALAMWCLARFRWPTCAPGTSNCMFHHGGLPALPPAYETLTHGLQRDLGSPPARGTLTHDLQRDLWLCLATIASLQLCLLMLKLACTAGLGIFEYMLLAEELKAEPVWVFNSGNSHTEYIPNDKLHPFVEDVLQSIEFVTGAML